MELNNWRQIIHKHKKVSLDTMGMIYFLEKNDDYFPLVAEIFSLAEKNEIEIILSVLASLEFLTGALRFNRQDLVFDYKQFLQSFPTLTVENVSAEIAEQAAILRAKYNIKTPDAIHLATAIVSQAEIFITNDKNLMSVNEIKIICLKDYI